MGAKRDETDAKIETQKLTQIIKINGFKDKWEGFTMDRTKDFILENGNGLE